MNALIELKNARQLGDERRRRWFISSDLDLIVWYNDKSISGFELYYDKSIHEHVLIWSEDSGYIHLAVDDGEQKPVLEYKEAPILIPDGYVDPAHISRLFEESCGDLPPEIVILVSTKLGQFSVT